MNPLLAVIGGTGLYRIDALAGMTRHVVETPWGAPSDAIACGNLDGRPVAFLARHGERHSIAPDRINNRANLWALQALGVRRIVAVNAVGGIRADVAPRAVVVPDQIIDYTWGRDSTFGGDAETPVRHIDFSEPYDPALRRDLLSAAEAAGVPAIDGACYGATQGPRLETRAEIARMRRDGCDLVGMTGMPEAALARELGLAYACLALVANWAAGCGGTDEISLDEVHANLAAATAAIAPVIRGLRMD